MLITISINKESLAIVPFSFGDRDVAGVFKQYTTPCSTVVEKTVLLYKGTQDACVVLIY